jgi:prepilin-type N-terminal cleavage/methylation domain-containing protein
MKWDRSLRHGGFTLLELLVVIAVIGLLASIILASMTQSRAKGRDAKRRQDLRQLQTALELFYSTNGGYPFALNWWGLCPSFNQGGSLLTSGPNGYIPNLAPAYISVLPTDPKPVGNDGCYLYSAQLSIGNGLSSDYKLMAHKTVESAVSPNDGMYDAARLGDAVRTYSVYTDGGRNW